MSYTYAKCGACSNLSFSLPGMWTGVFSLLQARMLCIARNVNGLKHKVWSHSFRQQHHAS